MPLVLCSKSTEIYAKTYSDSYKIITKAPDDMIAQCQGTVNHIIAIGGGSVIDTAKILSRNRVIAIPTTFSGASKTNHAVYWTDKAKISVKTPFPFTIITPEYLKTLDEDSYQDSLADCIAHLIESKYSKRATRNSLSCVDIGLFLLQEQTLEKTLIASLLAGSAIQTTGTTFIHALSYPLTYKYQIPHGRALRYILFKLARLLPSELLLSLLPVEIDAVDWGFVISEASKYPQFYRSTLVFSHETLLEGLT